MVSSRGAVAGVFGVTSLLSAFLLFFVQPMVGKWLLPVLGGAPAVWNACMVFFQAVLLLGYLYSHGTSRLLKPRAQIVLHLMVLALPALVLPIALPLELLGEPPAHGSPLPWLLLALSAMAGLPFFVISTSSPLLQRWYGRVGAPNPYVLYATSNAGSLMALLGYPLVMEPLLTVRSQGVLWAAGYGVVAVLLGCCALVVWRASGAREEVAVQSEVVSERPSWRQRGTWLLLSAIPSSLMLGVTTFLSTDVAAIPLLWIVPLSLYLLTFILVFGARPRFLSARLERATCLVATFLVVAMVVEATTPGWLLVSGHIAVFFAATMICHGRLARSVPEAEHLTEFYLWMSVGGVLGGSLNTFVAPVVFDRVWEYPLVMALACAMRPAASFDLEEQAAKLRGRLARVWPWWWALVAVFTALNIKLVGALGLAAHPASPIFSLGLPALLAFSVVEWPRRFGLALAALVVAGSTFVGPRGEPLFASRSFYGQVQVTDDAEHGLRRMFHGTTLHGMERLEEQRSGGCTALNYYWEGGPAGRFFRRWRVQRPESRVAVVGLGVGALACYAAPGQAWTFYELDPEVVAVARDERLFTILKHSPTKDQTFVVGDARLRLKDVPPHDVLVIDAFSSDAIPVHLMTREAMQLYMERLREGGVLVMHVSSRSFKLAPVVARLAESLGLVVRLDEHTGLTPEEMEGGATPSMWMFLARDEAALAPYEEGMGWTVPQPAGEVWTDGYTNLLGTMF
jgi:SAM-dependent methyltransferase